MLSLILTVALHLGGNYTPNDSGSVYCGTGTTQSQDSSGNTACVGSAAVAAVQPSVAASPTVVVAEPQIVSTGYGLGWGRGFGRFHR